MTDGFANEGLISRAEELILRIRDIQSCRIALDEKGAISEVHVVAATERPPKMIARDVETCLKAELNMEIDYRKIGVVLIDTIDEESREWNSSKAADEIVEDRLREETASAPPKTDNDSGTVEDATLEFLEEDQRILFKGLSMTIDESRVDAEVKLEKNGFAVTGCQGDFRKAGPIYETIAGATIHAVTELLDEDFHLCLSGVDEVEVSERKALIAVIDMIDGRVVRSFAGSAFIGRDPNEATVLAVLDAVNRPSGRWKSRKEIHYRIS